MTVEQLVFAVCAVLVISGAFGVVFSRNPVHSALSLVGTLFAIAVLFLNLGANLLAVVQVIVVLILFVLMLLGVDRDEDLETEPLVGQRALAALAALAIGGAVLAVVVLGGEQIVTGAKSSLEPLADAGALPDIRQIGDQLFTTYVLALEITAALLTVAVVGAVVMSRRPRDLQPLPDPESMEDIGDQLVTAEEQTV